MALSSCMTGASAMGSPSKGWIDQWSGKERRIVDPSKWILLLGQGNPYTPSGWGYVLDDGVFLPSWSNFNYDIPGQRHFGKNTTVMADGHVEWVSWLKMRKGTSEIGHADDYYLLP